MHGSKVKVSASNVEDPGSIPGLGRSPGEGNGNPLQYSCLENPMDGGAWQATVHGVAESDTTEQLHFQFHFAILHVFYTYEVISHCVFVNDCKYINKISGQIQVSERNYRAEFISQYLIQQTSIYKSNKEKSSTAATTQNRAWHSNLTPGTSGQEKKEDSQAEHEVGYAWL